MDLNTVIAQGVETVQPFIDGRRQAPEGGGAAAAGLAARRLARLAQVIANLLHNAAKYSPEGDWHRADALGWRRTTSWSSVRDEGIGIDAELLPRIFDLFAQGERGLDRAQADSASA